MMMMMMMMTTKLFHCGIMKTHTLIWQQDDIRIVPDGLLYDIFRQHD